MSVCVVGFAVSDQTISEILADPPLILQVVDADDEARYLAAHKAVHPVSLLDRLLGRRSAPPPRRLNLAPGEGRELDLNKFWDGLRRCLEARSPDAAAFFDGTRIADKVLGGVATYHLSDEMKTIADNCLAITDSDLLAALASEDFSDVYLSEVWEDRDEDAAEALIDYFHEMRSFLEHVKEHGLGAIILPE